MIILRLLIVLLILGHALPAAAAVPLGDETSRQTYVCPVCPHVDDLLEAEPHAEPGTCPVCGMTLVERPILADGLPAIVPGPGAFTLRLGRDGSREVSVFSHAPKGFNARSPVLFVLPGAGRNAWDYRDHWIAAAERHGVLVLALHYSERRYPRFWNYNLAGMVADVEIDAAAKSLAGYRIVEDRGLWLFDDIEHIFRQVVQAAGLETDRYDLFGHSAGGQFLHRFALFAGPDTHADRILASNSGWYTVPDRDQRFPFGLAGVPLTDAQLATAFSRRLVVFLGGNDNENETRGDLVRSADTDRQGLHRLARGRYFHERSKEAAEAIGADFRWEQVVVPGIGHDPKGMSQAAARYLYGPVPDR